MKLRCNVTGPTKRVQISIFNFQFNFVWWSESTTTLHFWSLETINQSAPVLLQSIYLPAWTIISSLQMSTMIAKINWQWRWILWSHYECQNTSLNGVIPGWRERNLINCGGACPWQAPIYAEVTNLQTRRKSHCSKVVKNVWDQEQRQNGYYTV